MLLWFVLLFGCINARSVIVPNADIAVYNTKGFAASLLKLSNQCENQFIGSQIKSQIASCSNPENIYLKLKCQMFYDINARICSSKSNVTQEVFETQIKEKMVIDDYCNAAKEWDAQHYATLPEYKAKFDAVFKKPHLCTELCIDDNELSEDVNFYCKYFKWGLDTIKTVTVEPSAVEGSSLPTSLHDSVQVANSGPTLAGQDIKKLKDEEKPKDVEPQINKDNEHTNKQNEQTLKQEAVSETKQETNDKSGITQNNEQSNLGNEPAALPVDTKPQPKLELPPKAEAEKKELGIDGEVGETNLDPPDNDNIGDEEDASDDDFGRDDTQNQEFDKPAPEIPEKPKLKDANELGAYDNMETPKHSVSDKKPSAADIEKTEVNRQKSDYMKENAKIDDEIEKMPSMPNSGMEDDDGDDNFFSFFLTVIVVVVFLYVLYHNKSKVSKVVFGLLVEGRQPSRRRNSRGHSYRRLDTLEQAMNTSTAAPPSKIIY